MRKVNCDTRRNHITCYALLILESNPRYGRGNNDVGVLARARSVKVFPKNDGHL